MSEAIEPDAHLVNRDKAEREQGNHPDNPFPVTCPDCGGVLWELRDGDLIRFRCHVGHAYSIDSLLAEQANDLEQALWEAIRALEEKAALARRMAANARQHQRFISETQFLERAREARHHADLVRQIVLQQEQAKRQSDTSELPNGKRESDQQQV